MLLRSLFAAGVFLAWLAPARSARACGPDFPPHLLADRASTLADLPQGAFALEASRFLPKPADTFPVVEDGEPEDARTGGGAQETALYTAGAKAFEAGNLPRARARFQEVLALPAEERKRFSTFAAFMLGRTAAQDDEARRRYAEVRERVRQGFDDPLGLAVASLGQEARLLLEQGDDAGALRLYAEQAAHGSGSAVNSLLMVARALTGDEARLKAALKDPLAQRVMATFVWTHGQDWVWGNLPEHGGLKGVLEALAALPEVAGADRLAAGAWRAGRFDLAERFAGQEDTPLASWVKAKLAIRRGDRAAAEEHLEKAAAGLPESEDWAGTSQVALQRPKVRAEGERALLALARGDFPASAERMVASCSWPDLAQVAERVLTVEELQKLVAAQRPGQEEPCKPELGNLWYGDTEGEQNTVGARLRHLLARRLLRTGAGEKAVEYFRGTPWQEPAERYVKAQTEAKEAKDPVTKAQALYTAARLARELGMELMGTEVAPDWSWVDGMFDLSDYELRVQLSPGEEPVREELAKTGLVTQAEEQRVKAHAPPNPVRFHYRSLAADLAEQAAALVPPRSQAYAMLLCYAARVTSFTEPERQQRLWSTYVKNGALIREPWAFGQVCPEPDFERARAMKPQRKLPWEGVRRRTLAAVGLGVLVPVVLLALLLLRRRREPHPPRG